MSVVLDTYRIPILARYLPKRIGCSETVSNFKNPKFNVLEPRSLLKSHTDYMSALFPLSKSHIDCILSTVGRTLSK